MGRFRRDLPQFYYEEHFGEMLNSVRKRYEGIFDRRLQSYLTKISDLQPDARRLYLRLANRKPIIFCLDKLVYPEIQNIDQALKELCEAGLLCTTFDGVEHELWSSTSRKSIVDYLKCQRPNIKTTKLSRAELDAVCVSQLGTNHPELGSFCRIMRKDDFNLIKLLYFGRPKELNLLAQRDMLGKKSKDPEEFTRRQYKSLDDARLELHYFDLRATIDKAVTPSQLKMLSETRAQWPKPATSSGSRLRHETLFKLASKLERANELNQAKALYRESGRFPATERLCRLVYKDCKNEAEILLRKMISDPGCFDELEFAKDFYARKYGGAKLGTRTKILREADTIEVDESFLGLPELGVLKHFERQGATVFKTENKLWKSLFGLVFWDLLFSKEKGTLLNPWQSLPTSLRDDTFYSSAHPQIESTLDKLESAEDLKTLTLRRAVENWGRDQALFKWSKKMMSRLDAFIAAAPIRGSVAVLREMAKEYSSMHSGFPDLMIIEPDGQLKFREVKSPSDQIRRNQLRVNEKLRDIGFDVGVTKIVWKTVADQPFVVVDVETTGGRAASNRVTEIGAVKYINGQQIDTFQTLVNPLRPIPRGIQRLTGISDQMVANAPLFSEVAEKFHDFLDGSVFAAHNVKFDYSFIREEFKRCGIYIKMPRLCTCATMRKHQPGLKSYSLKNLSREFDVELVNHHRALDDALAAGKLLAIAKGWDTASEKTVSTLVSECDTLFAKKNDAITPS